MTGRPARFALGKSEPLLLAALLAGALVAAVLQPIRSYDLWWHLATGRLILETGSIPTTDPFSFTRSGTPWLDHAWLFQIVTLVLYRWGGWPALLGMDLILALTAFLLLARVLREEGVKAEAGTLILLLSLSGARFRFDPRPEMFSLLAVVILGVVLHASRRRSRRRWVWMLPPLFLLWANTHPAAVLGAALVVVWVGAEAAEAWWRGRPMPGGPRRSWPALAAPLLVLGNPGGWSLIALPVRLRNIIASGHAPNLEWGAPSWRDFPLFYFGVVLLAAVILAGFRWIDPAPTLSAVAVGILALLHLRNVGFFFLLLPLALARPAAALPRRIPFPRAAGRLLVAAALLLCTLLFLRENRSLGRDGYLSLVAPEKAVDFLETQSVGERLLNDVKFGGYLIWRRYPAHRVFIDGRNEVYDPLLAEIFGALRNWESWESLLNGYRVDAALLRRGQTQAVVYPPRTPGSPGRKAVRAFSAAYFQASRWALVYWDDQALLFVRRDIPAYAPLIRKEFRVVNPDDQIHLLEQVERGELTRQEVLEEIDRKLAEDPECRTARRLKAWFAEAPAVDSPR